MSQPRVVIDTNVLFAGLRSRRGASFQLLSRFGGNEFTPAVSVPLVLEYEDALMRLTADGLIDAHSVGVVVDYVCSISHHQRIFYLWRPRLRDPKDDMVLELAVAASCQTIVTFNIRDFKGSELFGIEVVTPAQFLDRLEKRE